MGGVLSEYLVREDKSPGVVQYSAAVPFEDWMDGGVLVLRYREFGCCDKLLSEAGSSIALYQHPRRPAPVEFKPRFIFVQPQVEVRKERALSGEAYVTFMVNRTEVREGYQDNARELGKIRATIDSVRFDGDITVTGISLKGYASPEGRYAQNESLAKKRSWAIRDYVQRLYPFPSALYTVDYEPENWEGLRNWVLGGTSIEHKSAILDIIDAVADPDKREREIKSKYPGDYRRLLEDCYPSLRRTDYKVEYTIRSYADPEEIVRILKTRPQNLSLNEFYIAANEFEDGSQEFNDVFATAVRMYPDDEVANLNAAMAEMDGRQFNRAARFLQRAGDSPEAIYARGILEAFRGDFDAALPYLQKARGLGVTEAQDALSQIKAVKDYQQLLAAYEAEYGEAAL